MSASLWRNAEFLKLWSAQTLSKGATHMTRAALAAAAVLVLNADSRQMGLLGALGGIPALVLSLFAGVWVDRLRRKPILIFTDLARGLVLGSIPLAAWLGVFRIEHLYGVALLVGSFDVLFNVADASYLPSLLPRDQLIEGNGKMGASESLAEMVGPALAGSLIQWAGAPWAIVMNSLTYLCSAAGVGLIRQVEPPPAPPTSRRNLGREIAEGLSVMVRSPFLRALTGARAMLEFFGQFIGTVYWLLLVREWGLTPAWVGLSVGLGGVGALVGTLIVGPVTRRVGIGRALVAALIFAGLTSWIVPAARGSRVFLLIVILATQLLGDIVWPFYFVNDTSLRQAMTPRQLLGRASASTNLVVHGITPLGSVIAGALASLIGLRWTWLFGGIGVGLASLWLIFSPVGRLRALPAASLDPAPSPDGEGACPGSP